MNAVYVDWANALEGFTIAAIDFAIDKTGEFEHPPNQGAFAKACSEYSPPQTNVLKLSRKYTPEELKKNRERLKNITEMLAKNKAMA